MNLFPSMLIAATIAGGTGNIQADISAANINSLQSQINTDLSGQVMIGNSSNIESILGNLGINLDSLKDCFPSDTPGTQQPETAPDAENPDAPGTGAPDTEPPNTEAPDTETPAPDTEAPDTEAPEINKPGIEMPGTGTEDDAAQSYAGQVVSLINIERSKAGLSPLHMSEELNAAALTRAGETAQSFSHTRPDGSSFSSVLTENNISYRGSGENIAWGQSTPETVVNAWMNSDGHRANILNSSFTSIGVGYYLKNGTTPYWAQLFIY